MGKLPDHLDLFFTFQHLAVRCSKLISYLNKAVITLIGGSKVTVTYFQTFRKFVDSIIEHATFREDEDEYD